MRTPQEPILQSYVQESTSEIDSLTLAEGKAVYFFSDVHLGSPYHPSPIETEKRLVRWLRSIEEEVGILILLGDIFDYWFEYKDVVPKGYTRFIGQLGRMADEGVDIHFFTGNHDIWCFGYLEEEIGLKMHYQPWTVKIAENCFFLAHGDEFDYRQKSFRFWRAIFHNNFCQKLYAAVHPRFTVGLAHKLSERSRAKGLQKQQENYTASKDFLEEQEDYLIQLTKAYVNQQPNTIVDYFIYGHTHKMIDLMLPQEKRLLVLGDWLQYNSFLKYSSQELYLDIYEE